MKPKARYLFEKKASIFPRSLVWARFYIFWRFPIGIVFTSVFILMPLTEILETPEQYDIPLTLLVVGINTVFLTLTILTYIMMKTLSIRGYYMNLVYLLLNPVFMSLQHQIDSTVIMQMLILYILWVLPNLLYFSKRKAFFQ